MGDDSINGRLDPRSGRLARGSRLDYNLISPERLARQRGEARRRLRLHLIVIACAVIAALVVVPLRGRAHVGPEHYAAAYDAGSVLTPVQDVAQAAPAPPGLHDATYLRAPLAIDGVNQARVVSGLPIQGQAAAVFPSPAAGAQAGNSASPDTVAAAGQAPGIAPGPDAASVGGAGSDAAAGAAPTDTPEQPNDPSVVIAVPDAPRNDPVAQEDRAQALAALAKPLFYDHVVRSGDTVSTIASRYDISITTVLANNPLITDANALFIGQTLRIPATDGVLYDVHAGDTLADIAQQHDAQPKDVLSLAANGLADASQIHEGQTILIVGGKLPAPPPPPPAPEPAPVPAQTPAPAPTANSSTPAPAPPKPPAAPPPTAAPASASLWIWPAHGPITSCFCPDHPLGIDIGQGPIGGQPIVAARAGVVTFAGGNPCCSYGYYVDIDHGGGWSSRYGHFRAWPIVSVGQHVEQGQVLGYAGTTGYSTGPHLHFEIHLNGQVVNPMNYLPPGGN